MKKLLVAGVAVMVGCGAPSPAEWRISASEDMTEAEREDLDAALDEWREAVGDCGPPIPKLRVEGVPEFPEARGHVSVRPGDPGKVAVHDMEEAGFEDGVVVEAAGTTTKAKNAGIRVVFRRARDSNEEADRRRVFLHELGHAFGLGHGYGGTSAVGIMNSTTRLTEDDAKAYRAKWCT